MRDCRNCPDRAINCHADCRDYKLQKLNVALTNAKRRKAVDTKAFLVDHFAVVAKTQRKKTGGDNYTNWRKNHR